MKNVIIFLVLSISISSTKLTCSSFMQYFYRANLLDITRMSYERSLQSAGIVVTAKDIEFPLATVVAGAVQNRDVDILTLTAKLIAEDNSTEVSNFSKYASCTGRSRVSLSSQSFYQSISGYGNNPKNPYWASSATPFARFGPKTFDDGIYSVRRSLTGSELPGARFIVNEVLMKSEKKARSTDVPNLLSAVFMAYIAFDFAQQRKVKAPDGVNDIRCCGSGNKNVLPPILSHSACLPVTIPQDDELYSKANITCLNVARSQLGMSPDQIGFSEIKNIVTGFLDHSSVYGTDDQMMQSIRTFLGGKMRLSPGNVIPQTSQGRLIDAAPALVALAQGTSIPALFSRNHNKVADALQQMNPQWNDERLFQEARKINIAIYHNIIYSNTFLELFTGRNVSGTYDINIEPTPFIEFATTVGRFIHYHVPDLTELVDAKGNMTKFQSADLFGRLDIAYRFIEDIVRGSISQPISYGKYSDELKNNLLKNNRGNRGFGFDVLSTDITRGRDHGLASYLGLRRKCGLPANFTTFDDLQAVLPKNHTDLLKTVYDSVEDIDLYVGGALEAFAYPEKSIFGETLACIAFEQFSRSLRGDAYYFTHKTSPYPFTDAQITAIKNFDMNNLVCQNTNLNGIGKTWYYAESSENPTVLCKDVAALNLKPWMQVLGL